ncbi:hypothetical protein K458DRAFT_431243 [Lentithecium fluviatile CBS 122367]|uniref:Uncharacterized protein n=1 Tax=Lentithecium fluviatile CBS 122367 TaxID=1168545 RepID=A0A6G1J460_9PLEO|nr:hypothetical protein K458DRAFT_431243 [Lentithecium fluviatile CBS 122367]
MVYRHSRCSCGSMCSLPLALAGYHSGRGRERGWYRCSRCNSCSLCSSCFRLGRFFSRRRMPFQRSVRNPL